MGGNRSELERALPRRQTRLRPDEPAAGGGCQLGGLRGLVAQGGQQSVEVVTARAAGAQVRRDAGVELLCRTAGGGQLGVDVQHFHRLGAAHVTWISPQETVQFRPAFHELLSSRQSSPTYPLAASAARSLR